MQAEQSFFGETVRSLRGTLGLSQLDLAHALGSTQRHISFLETGRSKPTTHFLSRLCTDLNLSAGQRANLFAASGLANPYEPRLMGSADIVATLDLISEHILRNWPFPAFVLDKSWNIIRMNRAADNMLATLQDGDRKAENHKPNLLEVLLSDAFMGRIANWIEASPMIYFRLQASSLRDRSVAELFERARSQGLFDHIKDHIVSQTVAPVFVPIELDLGLPTTLKLTSLVGNLAANQDALVEEFEIELMIPIDAASDAILRGLSGDQ